jgi:two-component sensor histidine kinase
MIAVKAATFTSCESELISTRRELDHRVRNNLSILLGLVRLEASFPPSSAAEALSRVAGHIATVAAIYDRSEGLEEYVDPVSWCESLIASIAKGLERPCIVSFSSKAGRSRIQMETAQTLGLIIGELIVDAASRAFKSGREPRIDISLERGSDGEMTINVRDQAPCLERPQLAIELASLIGGKLQDRKTSDGTERILVFRTALS